MYIYILLYPCFHRCSPSPGPTKITLRMQNHALTRRYCPRHFPRYIFSMIKVLCDFSEQHAKDALKNRSFWLSYLQLIGSSLLLSIRSFSMFHSGKFCFAGAGFRLLAILFKIVLLRMCHFAAELCAPRLFRSCGIGVSNLEVSTLTATKPGQTKISKGCFEEAKARFMHKPQAQHFQGSQRIIFQSPRELLQT